MRSLTLVALVLAVGCTQDFGAFDPVPTSGSGGIGASGGVGAGPGPGGGGSGAVGATGGLGGAGAVGGMPGGFGGTGDEVCQNGVDDDMDGDVDCADSDCTPLFDCVPDVPVGWSGPVALAEGAAVAACGGAYTMLDLEGFSGITFDPVTCSGCACAEPTVTCTPGPIEEFQEEVCTTSLVATNNQTNDMCSNNDSNTSTDGVIIDPPTATANGNCTPSGGAPTVSPVTWQTVGTVCGTDFELGAGCSAGSACAPKTPGGFGAAQCVFQTGDQACPAGYADKHLFQAAADDYVDTRDCSACSCGAPEAACTGVTEFFEDNNNCPAADLVATVPNDGACHAVTVTGGWKSRDFDVLTSEAPCATDGGAPTGTVTPGTDVVTVCCSG